jgi:hypothetical protein
MPSMAAGWSTREGIRVHPGGASIPRAGDSLDFRWLDHSVSRGVRKMSRWGRHSRTLLGLVSIAASCHTGLLRGADVPPQQDQQPVASAANPKESQAASADADDLSPGGLWRHRDKVIQIQQAILDSLVTSDGKPLSRNPGQPFTYEEATYDKPNRDWWWNAGRFTVVILGSLVLTYFTAGVALPYVGAAIGGASGLTGAAAVSHGLAILGGGAIAAGGFGIAGGTVVVGLVTDLAISTALDYSLRSFRTEAGLEALNLAMQHVDSNHDQKGAWEELHAEAVKAASDRDKYCVVSHAVASAFLRWAADENIERALATKSDDAAEITMSDRQQVLMAAAIRLLEDVRRLEPDSSLVHHALGNLYWWLSVRGGFAKPVDTSSTLAVPASARIQVTNDDEVGCFQAAIWHYAAGAASEPRNVHVRVNWANALQADGTLHEAIGVMSGALPFIEACRASDQAQLLRTSAMLQYQAFTRSPLYERVTAGGAYPSLEESPLLMASMQGYTRALEIDENDLGSVTSLAQIYRQAEPTRLDAPTSVLSVEEVQFRLIKTVLKQEEALEDMERSDLPEGYEPGQLFAHYQDLLRWSFSSLAQLPLRGENLERLHYRTRNCVKFAARNKLETWPVDREVVFAVRNACKKYNDNNGYFSSDYPLEAIDEALKERVKQ